MSTVGPVAGAWRLLPSYHGEHVGYRYLVATLHEEELTRRQRARLQEEFADEFDRLPPSQEPSDGWAKTMAALCRTIAQQLPQQAATDDPNPDPATERRLPPPYVY